MNERMCLLNFGYQHNYSHWPLSPWYLCKYIWQGKLLSWGWKLPHKWNLNDLIQSFRILLKHIIGCYYFSFLVDFGYLVSKGYTWKRGRNIRHLIFFFFIKKNFMEQNPKEGDALLPLPNSLNHALSIY